METLIEIPAALEANVFGKLDEHLKKIERALNVTMVARDGTLKLTVRQRMSSSMEAC